MASRINGIAVTLYETAPHGSTGEVTDPFNKTTYAEKAVTVNNVLVAPASSQEILDTINLYGKKAVYTMAIPKGDTHDWVDKKVSFFGKTFRTFGIPLEGIECDIPLDWNKKVMVEIFE